MDSTNIAGEVAPQNKWCTTCKHCGTNASRDSATYKCFAPQNQYSINLVDGSKVYYKALCCDQRVASEGLLNHCYATGQWWEPKPAAPNSLGSDFDLPPVDKSVLEARLAAARSKIGSGSKIKVGTNLLEDLGM